jgi:hypothetical protein
MNGRLKKILLLLLAGIFLLGVAKVQTSLNRERDQLGITRVTPLENAPPVLAFTTVALGGFRGLIANALWIRASDLQDDDKFFEAAQLADWITKLEPHFPQVWVFQAWNMAYNISVKFKDYPDRWRWLQNGIELLRDEGLRYNPHDVLIHQQLAWLFQHKLGANLDDANMYYKQQWANEMAGVFGKLKQPDLTELVHPKTEDAARRLGILTNKFKMDPRAMLEVDEHYGPLEWRLPEAHAIYWADQGLRAAKANPTKVKSEDLIQLRRVIYQDMLLSFQRGRLEINPVEKVFEFGPNLDIIPKANEIYEQNMAEDERNRDHIEKAHRNFLRQAIYSLYVNNRLTEAARWFKYLGRKYPNKPILDDRPNSLPATLTLEEYAVASVQSDINETSHDRIKTAVEGLLANYLRSLILDQDERANGFWLLAKKVLASYDRAIPQERKEAIGLPPIEIIAKDIRNRMLDPERGLPTEARAVLRTKLGLPAEAAPPTPPATAPATNAPATPSPKPLT